MVIACFILKRHKYFTKNIPGVLCRLVILLFTLNFTFSVELQELHFEGAEVKDCSAILHEFANNTSQFTFCSIVNGHPIKLCEFCVGDYLNVQESYEKMMKVKDDKGEYCKKKFINVDRLAILENGYHFVQNLWLNGNCRSCFEILNGSMTTHLRNETMEFQNLQQHVDYCIATHYINGSYNHSVCSDCNKFYYDMNDFYEELKKIQGEENVCIDIVDSVNATRSKWNELLHCGRKEMKFEVELVAALLLACLLPVIFYVSTKQLSNRAETTLSQQKRLVQTFSAANT